jgi:hypothetical protein
MEGGIFLFRNLEAGVYELTIEAEGYPPHSESVTVTPGEPIRLQIGLTESE